MSDKKILYCDSRGDKRFSSFYAIITINNITDSIEHIYQSVKRDKNGNIPGKGKTVAYMVWNDQTYPASKLTSFFKYLWLTYFTQHTDLLEYAKGFDEFVDRFKGHSINNQGDTIAEIVKELR